MAKKIRQSINAIVDPETNLLSRESIEFNIYLPDDYRKEEPCGLVFSISGYGDSADSQYQTEKLCPYISDLHHMIVVGVRYHNDLRHDPNSLGVNFPLICQWYGLDVNHFSGMNGEQVLGALFQLLIDRNLFSIDVRLALTKEPYHKYSSFGFMPAVEHLLVLNQILCKFSIDRTRIIALGTSYGGYIATLMAKFAPETFSLIIDNSGFSRIQESEVFGSKTSGATGAYPLYHNGRRYEIPFSSNTIWSLDETSPYYFSDNHRKIRSLLINEHRHVSDTIYHCYHAENDLIAPTLEKIDAYRILSCFNKTQLQVIHAADIDGHIFKSLDHGMDASLRSIFDLSYRKFLAEKHTKEPLTDFDKLTTITFPCCDKFYRFKFSTDALVVEIGALR